jgi:hypothetical protein
MQLAGDPRALVGHRTGCLLGGCDRDTAELTILVPAQAQGHAGAPRKSAEQGEEEDARR